MKLRNKKTGVIVDTAQIGVMENTSEGRFMLHGAIYNSLAELNEDWEDYEEPKEYWYIDVDGEILCEPADDRCKFDMDCKRIGNYFKTKEEAERAVEKLKAWKRLKDKGFKFNDYEYTVLCDYAQVNIKATMINDSIHNDLVLLFGGEE